MRINARLDDEQKRKLKYLMRSNGARVSDVVKQAIEVLYERAANNSRDDPEKLLTSCGFVGCGESAEDFSAIYKDELKESLLAKQMFAKYDNS